MQRIGIRQSNTLVRVPFRTAFRRVTPHDFASRIHIDNQPSLIALVAAAVETEAVSDVKLVRPLSTLREVIQRDLAVTDAPELFCFGLLEQFDMPQLSALVRPRQIVQ